MIKLVLVRHGQSEWNLSNQFTGWTDVDLSENGIKEAIDAGKVLKEKGYHSRRQVHSTAPQIQSIYRA